MSPQALANVLRALSTERRIRALHLLLGSKDALTSGSIAACLEIDDQTCSYNLLKLKEVGLIIGYPSGPYVLYTPNRAVIDELHKFFEVKEQGE